MPATPHAYSRARETSRRGRGPTHDDAVLMVELAKWGSMSGLDEASRVIFADDFAPDSADASDPNANTMLIFGETVGTLVKNGLLNRALVLDWLWIGGSWARVGPAALRAREKSGVPAMFENFELLAAGQS
jgi:hypothetical protein